MEFAQVRRTRLQLDEPDRQMASAVRERLRTIDDCTLASDRDTKPDGHFRAAGFRRQGSPVRGIAPPEPRRSAAMLTGRTVVGYRD